MIAKFLVGLGAAPAVALEAETATDALLLRSLRLDYEEKVDSLAITSWGASPSFEGDTSLIIGLGSRHRPQVDAETVRVGEEEPCRHEEVYHLGATTAAGHALVWCSYCGALKPGRESWRSPMAESRRSQPATKLG